MVSAWSHWRRKPDPPGWTTSGSTRGRGLVLGPLHRASLADFPSPDDVGRGVLCSDLEVGGSWKAPCCLASQAWLPYSAGSDPPSASPGTSCLCVFLALACFRTPGRSENRVFLTEFLARSACFCSGKKPEPAWTWQHGSKSSILYRRKRCFFGLWCVCRTGSTTKRPHSRRSTIVFD